jgi:PelA/Pel-15E family pectate lyase
MRTVFGLLTALLLTQRFVPAQEAAAPPPTLKLEVKADYLALRITGTSNIQGDTWQWRVLPVSAEDQVAWSNFDKPVADTAFKLATPMPAGGWYRVDVRVLEGDKVIKSVEVTRPEPPSFEMVTPSRIATLPEGERKAWTDYLAISAEHARTERHDIAEECRAVRKPVSQPAPMNSVEFEFPTKVDAAYHANAEAGKLADVVISYQTPTGGWSKAVDYSKGPRPRGTHWTAQSGEGWHYCGTLDNRSTTEQIKFLAQVFNATKRDDCRRSVERGLKWIFAAQFPNGGWPQVYPLEPGYHEAVTLNDDAMMHALEVMRAVSLGEEPFTFCDAATKQRAASAYDRGIACLLAAQVSVKGKKTVWCAQHDPLTLAPVAARLKEPPSLSGGETTSLLKFLMRLGPTSEPVRQAVETAVAWLDAHKITDICKITTPEGKTDYVQDPASTEVMWARFYDLETEQPMFAGAQDGKIYSTFHEMAQHNKIGYDYFTTKPKDIVTKELDRWKKRLEKADKSK